MKRGTYFEDRGLKTRSSNRWRYHITFFLSLFVSFKFCKFLVIKGKIVVTIHMRILVLFVGTVEQVVVAMLSSFVPVACYPVINLCSQTPAFHFKKV